MIKKIFYVAGALVVMLLVAACGEYSKLLKGNDYDLKYTKAFEYYEAKKYDKALQLFEQIMPIYKGLDKGEKVMYYYTMCNYLIKDYFSAGYYFRKFAQTYPHSEYNEQAMYLGAYCYYLDSPKPSLDQESTDLAINEFELFLSKYPNTPKKDTCNHLLDELRYKLQVKSYDNAYLYYKLGYYQAATISLKNSLDDYPDSPFRENILYYIAKASYNFADMSVNVKKGERFQAAYTDLNTYLKAYPEGKYSKEIKKLAQTSKDNLAIYPFVN
ncbi:MAG: outer membrane protein assembly factor BamD [Bacteroidales bacterium]|nr:outer membrane protein assembly factor BamD [Bacteroidales bacterium]